MARKRWPVCVPALSLLLASGCQYVTRASVDPNGGDSDNVSSPVALSGDGRYVVLNSLATNLVAGMDDIIEANVFRRDLRTGATERVTIDRSGGEPDNGSFSRTAGVISADGRYVVFDSFASDMVPNDGNGVADVFVRDMQTHTTQRVSVSSTGGDANGASADAAISPNGRYVAFSSSANNLGPADGNGVGDVYVRDLQTNTTTRVSIDTGGGETNGASSRPALSTDGTRIAFESAASDLVANDQNGLVDIFERDMQTPSTIRVSVDDTGGDPDGSSFIAHVNGDGRYVMFTSSAKDLVAPHDVFARTDVFVRDTLMNTTEKISIDVDGGEAQSVSQGGGLSADGRYAAFSSLADDIVPNDTNQTFDGFVRDLATDTTRRISVDRFGNELAADQSLDALIVVISADGKYVAWDSEDDNVVPGDNNGGTTDAFVRSLILPAVDTVQPGAIAAGASLTFTVTGSGFRPGVAAGFAGNSQLAVTSVSFVSETAIDVNVTAAADAAAGGRTMFVFNPGSGPGSLATNFALCPCVTVTPS